LSSLNIYVDISRVIPDAYNGKVFLDHTLGGS